MVASGGERANSPADIVRRVHQPLVLYQDAGCSDHRARVSGAVPLGAPVSCARPQSDPGDVHAVAGSWNGPVKNKIVVTMIHGKKDEVVPVVFSRKILTLFKKAKKRFLIIKNGNHSLSNKKNLKKIVRELDKMVFNII